MRALMRKSWFEDGDDDESSDEGMAAGGGGWGDPLDRDPDNVLKDARNELVSPTMAFDDYGVRIDTKRWTVDQASTEAQRKKLRENRPKETPKVLWEEPAQDIEVGS